MGPLLVSWSQPAHDEALLQDHHQQEGHPQDMHVDPRQDDGKVVEGVLVEVVPHEEVKLLENCNQDPVGGCVEPNDTRNANKDPEEVLVVVEAQIAPLGSRHVRDGTHRAIPPRHRGQWSHCSASWHLSALGEHGHVPHSRPFSQMNLIKVYRTAKHARSPQLHLFPHRDVVFNVEQVGIRDLDDSDVDSLADVRSQQPQIDGRQRGVSDQRQELLENSISQPADEGPPEEVATPELVRARLLPADAEPLEDNKNEGLHAEVAPESNG
mmetsp:Transcript_20587/g.45051  ORF Transcript_20587/g.45051 Transcript_20587/m.45051 type:complete len:268 (-) Transcript_20587:3146-3949(-)